MRVVLCNPPRTAFELEELAPPVGLLQLAAIANQSGYEVAVEDYNMLFHLDPSLRGNFYDVAVERLLSLNPDVLGFTSMAIDSHLALEMGRRVKAAKPDVRVVLGGVHFSSIADQIRVRYPWVDAVISGEGESKFSVWLGGRSEENLTVLNQSNRSTVFPLYETVQWDPYFYLNPRRMANVEAGRGCRFRCSFCYSPQHFPSWRTFSIDSVLAQLTSLRSSGVEHFWFVEDNALNDEAYLLDLCAAIASAKLQAEWSCYATFPQLTPPVIEAMAAAGCTHVFSGIDAIGPSAEKAFHKAFLRNEVSFATKLERLRTAGIRPTCAFLLSPPSHAAGPDQGLTVSKALEAKEHGAQILLNPLTVYPGTGVRSNGTSFEYDETQADWVLDCPDICVENRFARSDPNLFPFHARFTGAEEWRDFILVSHCLATLVAVYPRTLREVWDSYELSPSDLAMQVVKRTPGLQGVAKSLRRRLEADTARDLLDRITRSSAAKAAFLLEAAVSIQ